MRDVGREKIELAEIPALNLGLLECLRVLKVLEAAPARIEVLAHAHSDERLGKVVGAATACEHPVEKVPVLEKQELRAVVAGLQNLRPLESHRRVPERVPPLGISTNGLDALRKVR